MANIYGGIDLIGGGTGAIDKINGSVLNDKDIFVTIKDGVFYPHWLDDDSNAGENSPQIISPDLNAGTKRWLLAGGVFADLTSHGDMDLQDGKFALTDADVAHGITNWASTDTYGLLEIEHATEGGLRIFGFSDVAGRRALTLFGILGDANPTDTIPSILLSAGKKDGINIQALGSSETAFQVENWGTVLLTILGNGNVGFGAAEPFTLLHLSSTDPILRFYDSNGEVDKRTYELRAIGAAGAEGLQIRKVNDANSVYTTLMFLDEDGKVCIGPIGNAQTRLTVEGTITLVEQAAADASPATYGQIWVKNTTPTELWFTDDAGGDHQIAYV